MTQAPNSQPCAPEQVEEWRPVVGYEGRYEVSSLGRVRSVSRLIVQEYGWRGRHQQTVPRRWDGRVLALHTQKGSAYIAVSLKANPKAKNISQRVHVLVASAFNGPCPGGQEVRHYDGQRPNNTPSNLIYGTRLENHQDTKRHGMTAKGEKNGMAKLDDRTVSMIKGLPATALTKDVADRLGVRLDSIRAPRRGDNWKHVVPADAIDARAWLNDLRQRAKEKR